MKLARLFVVIAVLALPAAAQLSKYKDWSDSPQGFFMTKAEREQWSAIKSDADAEQFVNKFLASRGPGFADEVAKRAAIADKYMTVGKTPASQTLRGKTLIVLGPPSSFNVFNRSTQRAGEGTARSDVGAAGADSAASLGEMRQAQMRGEMAGTIIHVYEIGYTADKLPAAYGKPFNVTFEVDAGSAKERFKDRKQSADLDALFETAAAASIKTK